MKFVWAIRRMRFFWTCDWRRWVVGLVWTYDLNLLAGPIALEVWWPRWPR